MEFTEKALVLKVGRFRENDMWLRLFCAGRGVLTAFAFGGCKSVHRFCGCLDPLVLANFRVGSGGRGRYNVLEEGALLHAFPGLRRDARKLGVAAHCLKFVEAVQLGQPDAARAFGLLVETLETLEAGGVETMELVPLLFKAKLTFEQGLAPDFSRCVRCGRPLPAAEREDAEAHGAGARLAFSVERGGLVCPECADVRAEWLREASVRVLERIGASRPADWPQVRLAPDLRRELGRVVDRFVAWHLGLRWDRGMYRKI